MIVKLRLTFKSSRLVAFRDKQSDGRHAGIRQRIDAIEDDGERARHQAEQDANPASRKVTTMEMRRTLCSVLILCTSGSCAIWPRWG